MTIRVKLTGAIVGLFAASIATTGYLLVRLQERQLAAETQEMEGIIANSAARATRDALIPGDDLLLISYLQFLRQQYPSLSYCKISWVREGAATRVHTLGKPESTGKLIAKALKETDPNDPGRHVVLELGLDREILQRRIDEGVGRLKRDLLRLFGITFVVTLLFSDWIARSLTKPLSALSHVAGEIGRGKLGARLEWRSKDEVGELVEGFNSMSARLEELDVMKKDFISAVTHELRSPLGAIDSFLGLMAKKMVNGVPSDPLQFQTYFTRIRSNVSRLSSFINDLLDVAKIERGKMDCVLKPMRVQDVAADVVQFFEAKCKEQGVTLANGLDRNLGPVEGDAERLRQVFVNLISNALKFTPSGGKVWIKSEQFRENGQRFLEVSVIDNGRGMKPEDQARLFEKFVQGQNVKSRVAGHTGTGLGLFIVKSIVESHGGQVSVRSEFGKGTQFLFNLKMPG